MKPRILFGVLFHETHTFLPDPTVWSDFAVARGDEILAKEGDESPTAGFLEEARRYGWQVVPTIDARAVPSGPVEDEVFERYWTEFSERAKPALAQGVDAIFLVLHGAMATRSIDDVEGELLTRLRALPGAARLPLFAVLDLHGNVSARMCTQANGLVIYRKNPHTDAKETALRTAALLDRCLRTGVVPETRWCRVPVMWSPPGTGTHADPMKALTAFAAAHEGGSSPIWAYNIAAGFSFADTAETGVTLCIVAEPGSAAARQQLEEGAQLAWNLREAGAVVYPSVDEVLDRIGPAPKGPVLLIEPADNIGGGAPGDCTGILRALVQRDAKNALVAMNDPEVVERLSRLPIGSVSRQAIGGRRWHVDPGPVEIDVELVSLRSGAFDLVDLHSHLASMNGSKFDMGPCAVVRHRGITVLLTSRKTPPFDLGQFSSQGIDVRTFTFIGIKAAVGHKQAFDPIAAASYYVDTPGPCSSNLATFPFRRLRRPIYPLDPITQPRFLYS